MRTSIQIQARCARAAGFTLVEMWIAMAIFTMLTLATVAIQLFAMRIYALAATKLTATDSGRKAVNYIREQVRSAKLVNIGNYSGGVFSIIGDNTNQIGSALYICPTSDETYGTIFYKDQSLNNLVCCQITNANISTNGLVIDGSGSSGIGSVNGFYTNANYITNYTIFQCENFQGNLLTNNNNNRIVHLTLMFSRWEYPIAYVANTNGLYDYYQLNTRVTRRASN
jgi:prepilin-type N-terminal cleavage/methylation domain-containing protein